MIARVYAAINAVAADLAENGVAKTRLNARDNYLYRSIDDVLERLAPLLARHRLCILPRVLERHASDRQDESGALLVAVSLRAAFDLVSAEDGSCHTIEGYGEALDAGDKATAKAMQSAYKYAVLQAFCIPALQAEDADARTVRLKPAARSAEPADGWQRWCDDLVERAHASSDSATLEALKADARPLLAALQRENPLLYREVGEAFAARSRALGEGATENSTRAEESQVTTEMAHPARDAAPRDNDLVQSAPSAAEDGQLAQSAATLLGSADTLRHIAATGDEKVAVAPARPKRRRVPSSRANVVPTMSNGSGVHG